MKLATKKRIEKAAERIVYVVEEEMEVGGWEAEVPDWVRETILTVQKATADSIRVGVEYALQELERDYKNETKAIEEENKELKTKLKRYEHIERAIQEADKK